MSVSSFIIISNQRYSKGMIDKLKDDCCGCGVCGDICAHKAIIFKSNCEGFSFPSIDSTLCIECNLCERVCPMLTTPVGNPIGKSLAAYSYSKPKNSSSGGMFSVLASIVLNENGTVYGATFDENMYLHHTRISTIEELPNLCGSKYVQSDCTGVYKQVLGDLKQNLKVLFVGTPCQVAGLKNYLYKDYDNLFLIDLICHGVPSPGIFADYLRYCEQLRFKKVTNFLGRDNRDGWNNIFKSTLTFHNGQEEYNSMLTNLWNRIFFSELAVRKNCEYCKFTSESRIGDLTLGDFWGIKKANNLMYNDKGVSLVLVNTNKGSDLIQKVKPNITSAIARTNEKEHPNLYHSIKQDGRRAEFMIDYATHGFAFIADKYFGYNRKLDIKIRINRFMHKFIKK